MLPQFNNIFRSIHTFFLVIKTDIKFRISRRSSDIRYRNLITFFIELIIQFIKFWTRLRFRPAMHVNRSEEHTSELQSRFDLVCRLLLEKKKKLADRPKRRS